MKVSVDWEMSPRKSIVNSNRPTQSDCGIHELLVLEELLGNLSHAGRRLPSLGTISNSVMRTRCIHQ
jgi:hypothetical protein